MQWNFTGDIPIYIQIIACLEQHIASGFLAPGDKLPSVRELAADADVNPNTIQKAFTELEHIGLVCSRSTSGRYVTADAAVLAELKHRLADNEINRYLSAMQRLGFSAEQAYSMLGESISGRK